MSSTEKAGIMEIIQKCRITVRAEDLLNPLYVAAKELVKSLSTEIHKSGSFLYHRHKHWHFA